VITCEYCGKTKKEDTFIIGAPPNECNDWTMFEGTGKIACPDCNGLAMYERDKAIYQHTKLGPKPSLEKSMNKALSKPDRENMDKILYFFDFVLGSVLHSVKEGSTPAPYEFCVWDFEPACEYLLERNSHRFGELKEFFEYPIALKIMSEPENIKTRLNKLNKSLGFNLSIKPDLLDLQFIIGGKESEQCKPTA